MKIALLALDTIVCFICLFAAFCYGPTGPGVEPMYTLSFLVLLVVLLGLGLANLFAAIGEGTG